MTNDFHQSTRQHKVDARSNMYHADKTKISLQFAVVAKARWQLDKTPNGDATQIPLEHLNVRWL